MNIFQFEPTPIAEWRKLVLEGQKSAGFELAESVENYVVITLDAYTTKTELSSNVIAVDFLKNIHVHSIRNMQTLRAVGDHCLILAGLFPDRAKRKNVSAEYFKHIGENAYYILSFSHAQKLDHSLFYQLFDNFADLVAILKAMRVCTQENILH